VLEQGAFDHVMKSVPAARLATIARLKRNLASPPASLDGIVR
jgi:hypothetical protein